jgi:hypothetical protein
MMYFHIICEGHLQLSFGFHTYSLILIFWLLFRFFKVMDWGSRSKYEDVDMFDFTFLTDSNPRFQTTAEGSYFLHGPLRAATTPSASGSLTSGSSRGSGSSGGASSSSRFKKGGPGEWTLLARGQRVQVPDVGLVEGIKWVIGRHSGSKGAPFYARDAPDLNAVGFCLSVGIVRQVK